MRWEQNDKKEKADQKPEEKNLDLVMKNDNWTASLTSTLFFNKENKSFNSANRWD